MRWLDKMSRELSPNGAYREILEHWPVPYQSLSVPTRFGETHVIESGPEEALPLILLPGNFASAVMWQPNVASLSRIRRVLAIDIPGEPGRSTASTAPTTLAAFSQWLLDLIDFLGLNTIDLGGLSKGGLLAAHFAIERPERIRKLILLCPGLQLAPPTFQWIILGMPMVLFPTRTAVRWFISRASTVNGKRNLIHEAFVEGVTTSPGRITAPPVMSLSELKRLQVPVLLLVGEQEILYNPWSAIECARKIMSNVQAVCIPGAGHFLNSDQPEQVNAAIESFLITRCK
jgi:pimeloyl-ACP methyl ester carboxylesterase